MHARPSGELIYPVGASVGVWARGIGGGGGGHCLLHAHTLPVVAVGLSLSGRIIVPAQNGHPGMPVSGTVWEVC